MNDSNEENETNALNFLTQRFTDNAENYGGSFAQHLNNDAAVQFSGIYFTSAATRAAHETLKKNNPELIPVI